MKRVYILWYLPPILDLEDYLILGIFESARDAENTKKNAISYLDKNNEDGEYNSADYRFTITSNWIINSVVEVTFHKYESEYLELILKTNN